MGQRQSYKGKTTSCDKVRTHFRFLGSFTDFLREEASVKISFGKVIDVAVKTPGAEVAIRLTMERERSQV